MNKEIIKKYKAEFDWWLDGGELLALYPEYKGEWVIATGIKWLDDTAKYVINDSYSEFRKALAEGKVIQFQVNPHDDKSWVDHTVEFDNFESGLRYYRIKPDKPEFKVGDWVTVKGTLPSDKFRLTDKEVKHGEIRIAHFVFAVDDWEQWALESASDDEWVIELKKDCKVNGVACDLFTVMTAFTAKRLLRNKDVIVQYIGQTPKELGLEGEL